MHPLTNALVKLESIQLWSAPMIAFGFSTVLGRIGSDKAGYISLIYPVIAIIISTFFEDYRWTVSGGVGFIIILIGNFIAMGKYKRFALFKRWQKLNSIGEKYNFSMAPSV